MKAKKLRRSLFTFIMAVVVVIGGIVAVPERASAAGITTASIDVVCKQYGYSNGKYWSYKGSANATKYTASSTGVGINGYVGYKYGGGIQCWAFARFLMYKVTNTEIGKGKWTKIMASNVSSLKVGDIVCTGDGVHTAVVYKDMGSGKFQFVQAFGGENNKINYGKYSQRVNNKIQQAETLQGLKTIGLQYVYRYGGTTPDSSTIANSSIKQIPSTLKQGSSWECEGTVSSNYKLKYVNGYILENTGKSNTWDEQIVYKVEGTDLKSNTVNSYKLISSKINTGLLFNKLSPGNYYYIITARDMTDAPLQRIQKFSIVSNAPTITNNAPTGVVDSVTSDSPGKINVYGWAYDPDSLSTALDIHVYVGGAASPSVPCTVIKANLERTDVNKIFSCGNNHGYNETIATNKTGNVDVYVYAIDTAGGQNTLLGKKTVFVNSSVPIGNYESVESISANTIRVKGWSFDKDTLGASVLIGVYIGGQCGQPGVERHLFDADVYRDDIDKANSCGKYHGFEKEINTEKTGIQEVYVWAHNTDGTNINTFLGSKTVNIHDCKYEDVANNPSCISDYTVENKCSICGKVKSSRIEKATGHQFDEGIVTRVATCTEDGEKTYTCERCGDTKTEAIEKTGHKFDDGTITKAATCTEDGEKTYTCANCGETKTEVIEKTGHTIVTDAAVEPTYASTGLTAGSHCSICGEVIQAQEIVPILVNENTENGEITAQEQTGQITDHANEQVKENTTNSDKTINENTSKENVSTVQEPQNNIESEDTNNKAAQTQTPVQIIAEDNDPDDEDAEESVFTFGNGVYEFVEYGVMYMSTEDENAISIIIPDSVSFNGVSYKVVSIDEDAFAECKNLKKVVLGKNVVQVGKNAFRGCTKLKSIIIKSKDMTKNSFGKNAFKNISKKATIKVPKKQYKNYKKWIKKSGVAKTVKIKK